MLHNFKPKCHPACVGVCCRCDVPTPLLLFCSLIRWSKKALWGLLGHVSEVQVQTRSQPAPREFALVMQTHQHRACDGWMMCSERWHGMCVFLCVWWWWGGAFCPCVVWEECDRNVPEHDAWRCWTEFSPLLSSLSSVLGAAHRSSDLTCVSPGFSPVTHKSKRFLDSALINDCAETEKMTI